MKYEIIVNEVKSNMHTLKTIALGMGISLSLFFSPPLQAESNACKNCGDEIASTCKVTAQYSHSYCFIHPIECKKLINANKSCIKRICESNNDCMGCRQCEVHGKQNL